MAKAKMTVDEENAEKAKYNGMLKADIENACSAINTAKKKSSEASGDLSAKLELFEGKGGHKKALKEATRVKNMEPAERADYLRARAAYELALDVEEQLDMIDQIEEQQKNADSISAASAAAKKQTPVTKPSIGGEPAAMAH